MRGEQESTQLLTRKCFILLERDTRFELATSSLGS